MKNWQVTLYRVSLGVLIVGIIGAGLSLFGELQKTGTKGVVDSLARTPLSMVAMFVALLTVVRLAGSPFLASTPVHLRGAEFYIAKLQNELLDAFIYAGVFVFMLIRPFGVQAFLIPSGSMWPTLHVNDFIVANKAIYRYTDPQPNDIVVFRPPLNAVNPDQKDDKGEVKVDFIKRCIGTPGQVIELRKGVLYRDGKPDPLDDTHKNYSECTDQPRIGECQNFVALTEAKKESLTKASFKLVKYKGQLIPLNYTDYDANSGMPMGAYGEDQPPYNVAKDFEVADQAEAKDLINQPAQPLPAGYYLMMGDNRNGSYDGRAWGLVPRSSIIGRAELIWLPLNRVGRTK
jgi:signal peptidase I